MRRKEFAARVWSKLIAYQRTHRQLSPGDRVLAAVSGGPDSVCLAHYLASLRSRYRFSLHLIHVHHGLRPKAADEDAAFVVKLGKSLGTPVTLIHIRTAERAARRGKGLEDAGRELRYDAIEKEASRLGCNKAATGHQLDDQAETVLLNLIRGTRLSALAAIPPQRRLAAGLILVRPLLALSRLEIMAYLRVHHLRHRLDRSNLSPIFTRNWLRLKVLPLLQTKNPRIREHLAGIAQQIRDSRLT